MSADNLLAILFLSVLALLVGAFLYKVIKHGGFKAAFFGAPIDQTVGEVTGGGARLIDVRLRIHKLNGGDEKAVGVELVAKSFASYQMMPVTLSSGEAKKLISLLQAAMGEQNAT